MHKKIPALIAALCVLFISLTLLPVHGESEIYDSFIRIHVLANSDSKEDQELKLMLRDYVLGYCAEALPPAGNIENTAAALSDIIPSLEAKSEDFLLSCGYSYPVRILLEQESYPTRNYESMSFPAGKYLSLKVLIGEAEGENWWCVLFPPLCLGAATKQNEDAFVAAGLTEEQYKVITDSDKTTYNVRFKILETFEEAFGQ